MFQVSMLAYAKAVAATTGNDLAWTKRANAGVDTVEVPYDGAIRLTVSVGTASVLYVRHNAINLELNAGVALAADKLYTFGFALPKGETFSLRIGTNCTFNIACVEFVPGAVL